MMAIAALVMVTISCTDEHLPGEDTPIPTPDPVDPTISAVLNYATLTHNWEYSDGLVVDYKKCQADITLTERGVSSKDPVNQVLPFEITWEKPQRMVRSTPNFKLEEVVVTDKYLSVSKTNNNLGLSTYARSFTFNFDGFSLALSTKNQEVKYNKHSGIKLPNCVLDTIIFNKQENEVIETYEIKGVPYQRTKATLHLDVIRHHTDDSKTHIDKIYPFIIVDAPVTPDPGEDMFNGAIPINGTEKLFLKTKIDQFNSIYTSERDVYEFWSVSGKKRVTYSTDLEIAQWIDDVQEAWEVPNMAFGNPKITQTENTSAAYNKEGKTDYEFEKTTSKREHIWSYAYNYKISTYASAEKAWKMYNGLRVMGMPNSKHLQNYLSYTYDTFTEQNINGETYLNYPSVINFNGSYNNDAYELKQNQEFLVKKGSDNPPAPEDPIKSETVLYEFENNSKIISRIIWRRDYQESGTRDSTAVQELTRSVKMDGDKQFVRENNNLSLKQALDVATLSEKERTDHTTGHVITTKEIRYGFDFDFFNYNIDETYQTAYTVYKSKPLNFIAPVTKVNYTGATPSDMGVITAQNGKKYNRTRYNLKFKETYDEFMTMLTANVDIDVEDKTVPPIDDIKSWSFDRNRDKLVSNIVLHIERNLSGKKDSVVTVTFKHENSITVKRHFIEDNNELTMREAMDPVITKEVKTIEGIEYTTITTVRKFIYNLYVDEITTVDQTAKITFQGTEIDFLAPAATSITYSGSKPTDMGIVTDNSGVEYNRTTYLNTYKVTFDGETTDLTAEVEIDVKKVDPKDEYVSHTVTKEFKDGISYITFHIVGTLSTRDSVATQPLAHQVIIEEDKQFYRDNNILAYNDMSSTSSTEDRRENGNYVQKVTTINTFKFNVGNSIVKTINESAYTIYRGKPEEFVSPESTVVFAGTDDGMDMGVVPGKDNKDYNRTKYALKYKETYNKVETPYSTNFNIDVEKKEEIVTRTFWEARDKGMQYISGSQWRTFFTLYEEFSNGTKKNTSKETYINVYVIAPEKRILDFGSNEFTFTSLTPGSVSTSNRSGGDKIYIVTSDLPYYGIFTNKDDKGLTNEYHFISETATYREEDIEVEFMTKQWENITNQGYNSPLLREVEKNGETYTRYDASFNIQGVYNERNYPASAPVYVDVYKKPEPTIDQPIDVNKTIQFGRLSWSWTADKKPFITGTIVTKVGIISFWDGGYCFTDMDTNTIKDKLGNTLWPENSSNYLIPNYITIENSPNKHWVYTDINGKPRDEVYGTYIEKLPEVTLNEPFFGIPSSTSETFKITEKDGTVRIKVTYGGKTIFNEVFKSE